MNRRYVMLRNRGQDMRKDGAELEENEGKNKIEEDEFKTAAFAILPRKQLISKKTNLQKNSPLVFRVECQGVCNDDLDSYGSSNIQSRRHYWLQVLYHSPREVKKFLLTGDLIYRLVQITD
jgi:hypothetical protein